MNRKTKYITGFVLSVLVICALTIPAFALTESDVQSQVSASGKEGVAGNLFVWFLCAVAFLKISQKIDSFMQGLGINVGHTGGSMLAEVMLAARSIAAARGVAGRGRGGNAGRSGSTDGSGGDSNTFLQGGLAGVVNRSFYMEGLTLSFPKVKIPAGGSLQFELPTGDPENPEYVRFLQGIILFHHASGAYWPEGMEYDDNTVPLCSTVDGKQGYGTPGGACAACELNRYGSATDGKGKACKNMRILYLLQDGDYIPVQLSLPPTSLRPFNDFMNAAFVARRRPAWSSVVQIGLKRVDNGNTYSVATFRKMADLPPEKVGEFRAFVESFRQQAKEMLKSRAELSAARENEDDQYTAANTEYTVADSGDHFCISGADVIDGEREELPQ